MAELRRLAEELGVPDLPWERGLDDASCDLVRQHQRRGQLVAQLERLRAARPLVEWAVADHLATALAGSLPPSVGGLPQTSFRCPTPPPVPAVCH